MNIMVNMSLNTFYSYMADTHTYTHVTSVTNGAIKVTLIGTTHNRTLVNSLSDQ